MRMSTLLSYVFLLQKTLSQPDQEAEVEDGEKVSRRIDLVTFLEQLQGKL